MDTPDDLKRSHAARGSRRALLRTAVRALGAAALAGLALWPRGGAWAADAPRESGLSFEGLLKGLPGFQPRTLAPLPHAEIAGFISAVQMAKNYAVYRAALAELIAAETALRSAPRDAAQASVYADLRRRQVAAANSVLLHEFFFRNLAPAPGAPPRYVMANLHEHMGSLASWREDFAACARVAGAWAALVYDPYDDRWHNVAMDDHDAGGWAGANPLVVCAVADHAWSIDYQDRDHYVAAFLDHIDWTAVAARYHAVDRQ
ncbi:MAG: hypothetical protein IVW54_12335 [Candidatus Binataceae bacterium]|nr:hypothetical protein [Candidatus Binataceae bacterium]